MNFRENVFPVQIMVKLTRNGAEAGIGAVGDDAEQIGMEEFLFTFLNAIIIISGIGVTTYLKKASLKGSATSLSLHSITTKGRPFTNKTMSGMMVLRLAPGVSMRN